MVALIGMKTKGLAQIFVLVSVSCSTPEAAVTGIETTRNEMDCCSGVQITKQLWVKLLQSMSQ